MLDTEIFASSQSSFAVRSYARADACAHAFVSVLVVVMCFLMPSLASSAPPQHMIRLHRLPRNSDYCAQASEASLNIPHPQEVAPSDTSVHVASTSDVDPSKKSASRKKSFSSFTRRLSFTRRRSSISSGSIKTPESSVSSEKILSEGSVSRRSSISSLKSTWSFHGRRRFSTSPTASPPTLETIFSASHAPSQCASDTLPEASEVGFGQTQSQRSVKRSIIQKKWLCRFKSFSKKRSA